MNILQLDHVALHVSDLAVSDKFYGDVLQLPAIPRPDFDFPGAWYSIGSHELHLIGNRDKEVHSHHRGTHFAVRVSDCDVVEERLTSCGIDFIPKTRPDGARQVFVQDPDGHFVEFTQPPA
ncbi:VOC family protein [Mariniblastus fucicola]|uniref:Fosfomycin resistance protein FosB n=1 Tax=Mariniblastus fucicola TaxID=980251 RepID=A0A5B9PA52_9BACT|nr:VOC family protein [Mariniblastus fucicola]QEG21810.1 fosfomycin resistance protein FosB [Mariniblastus fucicola]